MWQHSKHYIKKEYTSTITWQVKAQEKGENPFQGCMICRLLTPVSYQTNMHTKKLQLPIFVKARFGMAGFCSHTCQSILSSVDTGPVYMWKLCCFLNVCFWLVKSNGQHPKLLFCWPARWFWIQVASCHCQVMVPWQNGKLCTAHNVWKVGMGLNEEWYMEENSL